MDFASRRGKRCGLSGGVHAGCYGGALRDPPNPVSPPDLPRVYHHDRDHLRWDACTSSIVLDRGCGIGQACSYRNDGFRPTMCARKHPSTWYFNQRPRRHRSVLGHLQLQLLGEGRHRCAFAWQPTVQIAGSRLPAESLSLFSSDTIEGCQSSRARFKGEGQTPASTEVLGRKQGHNRGHIYVSAVLPNVPFRSPLIPIKSLIL
jgi:hypothetical protein